MKKIEEKFLTIKKCRLCESKILLPLVDFGKVSLGNNLQSTYKEAKNVDSFPLVVMRCQECNHFQLSVSVSPKLLYATNYTYLSGIGESFVQHMKCYTDWVINKTMLCSGAVVVDIGSNDGTLLSMFKQKGYKVCGVDPASKPSEIANNSGVYTYNAFFDDDIVKQIKRDFGEADLITSQNVLAHVENLALTFKNIYNLMKQDAYFVFEIGYFKKVLETGSYDTIYHEHLDYHHGFPLCNFLTSIGFDILDISENNIQGGSLRLLLKKTGMGIIKKQPSDFLQQEKKSILYDLKKLNTWESYVKILMKDFKQLVYNNLTGKETVIGYGAPTKAILLLKMSKIKAKDVTFIVDDNVLKIGKFIPMYGIPILSSSKIDVNLPTVIIIFAWNFSEDIMKKIKKLFKVPIKIITPLPKPKVYNL